MRRLRRHAIAAYGNVTTEQIIGLAQQESGLDLTHFFDVWLYRPSKPRGW